MTDDIPFDQHFARHWTGESHDPVLASLLGNDQRLPHVDASALSHALSGFDLPPRVPLDWMATAVRRALAFNMPEPDRMAGLRPGPTDARERLLALSIRARGLLSEIDRLPVEVAAPLAKNMDERSLRQFLSEVDAVRSLAEKLEDAAASVRVKPGAWRVSEAKALREDQALALMPVFQDAFDIEATIADPRGGELDSERVWPDFGLGPFPEFFGRMVRLATGECLSRDQVRDATKAARKRFKAEPFTHPPGIIPRPPA